MNCNANVSSKPLRLKIALLSYKMAEASLSDDTRYCKLVLLIKKCGNLVCKKYILKCVPPDKKCIDECLKDNEDKLKCAKQINESQRYILFPLNSTPTDLDQWDISLHSYILLNLFCRELTADNITAIKALRGERNNLCHSPSTIMSEIQFLGMWAHLSNVIFQLTKCLTTKDQEEIKDIENQTLQIQFHVEAVEQLELVERYEDDEGKVSGKIKSLEKRQDEVEKRLNKLEALESRVIELEARLKVEAPNHEAAEAAQTSLYNAAKKCVSNGLEESSNDDDDNDDVSKNMKNLSSDMKVKGVDIDKVEKGSIVFCLRCNSITALKNIYRYFADKLYRGRLTELENKLSERLSCSVKLNFSIILETLYTALTQIEKPTYNKSVVLTLKCRGAEGVRNAYKCLVNGSSTNAVNNVSEALSKSVGQKIELHTSIDTDKLERDLNNLTAPPKINTKVEDQTKSLGEAWELKVPISGNGPFTVKVMKDGTELKRNDHIEISSTADCVTVMINKLIMEDSGSYCIDVSNDIGTDTCSVEMKVVGKYNFRYQYLLVEIGTNVLRKLFDCKVGNNFGQYLVANPTASSTLTSLMTGRNRKITVVQEQLLPPIKAKPVSSDFDITLLTCLLRNVCGLRPPSNLAWMNPMSTDTSVEATLTRLRNCRNNLSHSGTVLFPETYLSHKWTELSNILSDLNKHCGKDGITDLPALMNAASCMDIDEEMQNHFTETVERWYENDQEVKVEVMKLQDEVKKIGQIGITRIVVVEEKVIEMAKDVSGIKRHIEDEEQTSCKRVKGYEGQSNVVDGSDIREKLIRIYEEDCSTLSVSPLFEDETTELLKIYQKPKMFRVNYNKEQRKENSKHERREEKTKDDKKVITSYQDIFCKEDSLCKKIYVTGDAGVGKTSVCKRMCLLWCKSKLNNQIEGINDDKGNERIKTDSQYMSRFDFVFYVSLRDTELIDVNSMIVEQLFYTDNDKERDEMYKRIKHILMNKDCLVILDGFDEWMPKMVGKKKYDKPPCINSEKCVVLTTCRPYKINNTKLSPTEIDHQVQITGLDSNSSYAYVEYLVKYTNEANHDSKNPDEFVEDVRKYKLDDLLCIPMIASHLVVLWFDRGLTKVSVAHIYSHILDMLFERAEKREVSIPKSAGGEHQLPDSLAEFTYLQQHTSLLSKLCLLSFKSFFNKDERAANLVFTKQQLMSEPYNLSNEESDFLCQIGILSKKKVIGHYLKQKQKMSFIHKSYIEFLAAFFVSTFDKNNHFDDIINEWTCVDDVVQYDNFFLLLTGFSYQKTNIMLEKMYQSISDHLHFCRINHIFHYDNDGYDDDDDFDDDHFYDYFPEQIKALQNMIVRLFSKVKKYNEQDCRLLIEDFIFDSDSDDYYSTYGDCDVDFDDYYSTYGDCDVDSDDYYSTYGDCDVDSDDYYSTCGDCDVDFDDYDDCLKRLLLLNTTCIKSIFSDKYYDEFDKIHSLQYLSIEVSADDVEKFTKCIQNNSELHTLCIRSDYTLIPELPVRSLHHLTSLSLCAIEIQHKSLHDLVKFLSYNVLIENIKLSSVSCDNHQYDDSDCTLTLDLPQHTKLTLLYLENVNILCNNVNNSSLQSVTLCPLSERIVRLCYSDLFNCIRYSQLEKLCVIDYLYMLDMNIMKTLTSSVKTLSCIKALKLRYMKLPDDISLQLHPQVTQAKIQLYKVTMSRQCFQCFIESCVNTKSEIKVELRFCQITSVDGETHSELSMSESWKYMFKYLESISTIDITRKDNKLRFISN